MSEQKKHLWIPVSYLFQLAILCSCSNEICLDPPPNTGVVPLQLEADISLPEGETATSGAANAYDRSQFIKGDIILVKKVYNSGTSVNCNYILGDGGKWTATSSSPLTLQAGATYQGRYPYNSDIKSDQSTVENFRLSNLLETQVVTSPVDEKLSFTGENAFVHKNTKLTLTFVSSITNGSLSQENFKSLQISGQGIIKESSKTEYVTLYRPVADAFSWCAILNPKATETTITVSLSYYNVSYHTAVKCAMQSDTHYTYTLTLKDNELIATGEEIVGWIDTPAYTGDIGETTN